MAQSGYTPISLYYSATGAAVPTAGNLVAGELALNTNDGKLYYKNSSGVVTLLAGATAGPAGGSTTQVQYNNAGVLAGITGATTNGTALTLVAPVLGTPASGTVTNLTGTASININGTVGATTPTTGAFTTVSASGTITASNATALTVPNGYQTLYRTTNDTSSLLHLQFFRGSGAGAFAGIYTTGDAANGVASLNLNINGTDIAKASSTGLAVTGTLDSTLAATVNSANSTAVALVVKGETGNGIRQRFIGQASSGQYNWQIGASITNAGQFEFIPSTVVDGTTFSTAVGSFSSTGLAVTGTLSATGAVTLSGGTANGVAYLDGSKVLTTGSALTFDGANVIINATTPAYFTGTSNLAQISINRSPSTGTIFNASQSAAFMNIDGASGGSSFQFAVASAANTQPTEQMRLTTTGLGIGTATPLASATGRGNITINGSTDAILSFGNASALGGYILQNTSGITYFSSNDTFQRFFINSAEQMRLTSTGLGIGTSSPNIGGVNKALTLSSAASTNCAYELAVNGVLQASIYTNIGTSSLNLGTFVNGPMAFYTNSTERMRIDSTGNLGIGTTTPVTKLDVGATSDVGISMTNSSSVTSGNRGSFQMNNSAGTTVGLIRFGAVTDNVGTDIQFYTRPAAGSLTKTMTLDSNGNLALNSAPSAFGATYKAYQANGYAAYVGDGNNGRAEILNNAYASANNVFNYYDTNSAGRYSLQLGVHAWFQAPSGTAGNAISFTQAMTLDAGGNLGIGTTSPTYKLEVATGTTGQQSLASFRTADTTTANNAGIQIFATPSSTATSRSTYIMWDADGANASGADYFYIQKLGNSGQVDLIQQSAAAMTFQTSGTERARIGSNGYSKFSNVGTYNDAAGNYHEFRGDTQNSYVVVTACTNATPLSEYIQDFRFSAATPNDGNARFWSCTDATAVRGYLASNGGLYNYSANNSNLSDRREKTNFAPATAYLDKICAIPVQTFNYIDQNLEEDGGLTLGVVAQDVQAVAPELVIESNWGSKEEPKMRLSIYQTDLQYALMKCIQEQQALITQLTARVAALEPSGFEHFGIPKL